ncbi:isopentenyl-diphosphate Delta-isomerase [Brevibacterium sp. Re57]|uniref:Isopentenyl-diphosphate Delta-isomerase n=2 Tax=Brevibacterium gallinarum TaxID=2762220 RepID=A0ABR8WV24_9MICO|nr:isopentenyl-diphosphate Delta-isomerase [Brevibacterium gallinarum]
MSVPIDALPRLLPGADGQVTAQFPASVQIAAAPWRDSALVDIVARIVAAGADEARGDGANGDHPSAAGTRGDEANGDGANGGEGAAGAEAGQGPVEQVVLVSDDGAALGAADKATVHTADTPLHQAFSCFVFDTAGRVLLTRRALSKKTWPGVWTNALCGHPGPGEPLAAAVHRRAAEELGCRLGDLTTVLPAYRYRATDASGMVENEICPVFTAVLTGDLDPAADEVAEYDWVEPEDLDAAVAGVPFMFSPWMQEEWQLLRAATGPQQA